jgi:predicted DNA-binding WGR domain protein
LKLIKQIRLFFQEGNSDKVYEIDLCEAGEGYVVNFRYGRRGASLKEGTKTIFPIELREAEKVFENLEQEKRKKGYAAAGEIPVETTSKPTTNKKIDQRKKVIVKLLKSAAAGEEPDNWPISRIIWRAGDLKITEAIPYIIKLANYKDVYAIYSSVWAIGRCGTENAIPFIKDIQLRKELPEFVRKLATEALLKIGTDKDKETLTASIIESLPESLRKNIIDKNYPTLDQQLRELLFQYKTTSNEYLEGIYQISRQDLSIHKLLRNIINELPLKHTYFKPIRHISKVAEMLEDYSIYGIIAKNIEKQSAVYNTSAWQSDDQKKEQAFSNKTKEYLTKRVVRQLKKYGEAEEDSYTSLASELLLAFNDSEDLTPSFNKVEVSYNYDSITRRHTTVNHITHFDSYAKFQAFNFILYKNSWRFTQHKNAWKCIPPYVPGSPAPEGREEAYPHLWNKASEEIIELLSYSKSEKVNVFALKVFKSNPDFETNIESGNIILFLQSSYNTTQLVGFELARKKYDRNNPDKLILIAMLDSTLEEARTQAEQWIEEQRSLLISDTEFVSTLLKMRKQDAHVWLRGFLSSVSFTKEQSEIIITKTIAFLLSLNLVSEDEQSYATQLGDTLIACFSENIKNINLDIIKDLFRHSSPIIHNLAGKILLKHAVNPENLPEDFLQILLQSDNSNSRGLGIALLGKFPERLLIEKRDMLVSFCLSPMADVRNAVKPLISKLVKSYHSFGHDLVNLFVPAFLMKETYEGLHEDLLNLLSNELSDAISIIPKDKTLLLLNSKFRSSQLLGSVLLKKTISDSQLSISELVKLASNPLQDVRLFVWNTYKKYKDKVITEKDESIRITDSYWDDTRLFAFDFFRNHFSQEDWDVELLVSLCDSTKEDVQDFGREMITRCFKEDQGTEYLLKLSQHPNTKVQLFSTAYLEKYADNNLEILKSLLPYFIILLSQVNKGKVAKVRVMNFLRKESMKNEDAAMFAAEIFTRVSVSMAINEKAECIAALRDIRKKYTSLYSPIEIKEYPDYIKN